MIALKIIFRIAFMSRYFCREIYCFAKLSAVSVCTAKGITHQVRRSPLAGKLAKYEVSKI